MYGIELKSPSVSLWSSSHHDPVMMMGGKANENFEKKMRMGGNRAWKVGAMTLLRMLENGAQHAACPWILE